MKDRLPRDEALGLDRLGEWAVERLSTAVATWSTYEVAILIASLRRALHDRQRYIARLISHGTSLNNEQGAPHRATLKLTRLRCWRALAVAAGVLPTGITTLLSMFHVAAWSPKSTSESTRERRPTCQQLADWFRGFIEVLVTPRFGGLSTEEAEFAARPLPFPAVASWNINWLRVLHSSQGRSKLAEIRRILKLGCILCLQETHWQPGDAANIAAATAAHVFHSDCPTSEKAGVAILIDRCSPWRVTATDQGPGGYGIAVTFSRDGHDLCVACIYADPACPSEHFTLNSRWIESQLLATKAQVIVIGDLNIRPTSGIPGCSSKGQDAANSTVMQWQHDNCFQEIMSRSNESTWQRGKHAAVLDRAFVGPGLANKGMLQWELLLQTTAVNKADHKLLMLRARPIHRHRSSCTTALPARAFTGNSQPVKHLRALLGRLGQQLGYFFAADWAPCNAQEQLIAKLAQAGGKLTMSNDDDNTDDPDLVITAEDDGRSFDANIVNNDATVSTQQRLMRASPTEAILAIQATMNAWWASMARNQRSAAITPLEHAIPEGASDSSLVSLTPTETMLYTALAKQMTKAQPDDAHVAEPSPPQPFVIGQ